jgi:hypothetical protein
VDNPWTVTYPSAPPEVRPWLVDVAREQVHGRDRPIELMPVRELEWILDVPLWWRDGHPFRLRPRDVLDEPQRYQAQHARTSEANLALPLEVAWHHGRWLVVDGVHRLLKAVTLGYTAVAAREVPGAALVRPVARQSYSRVSTRSRAAPVPTSVTATSNASATNAT